MKRTVSAEWLDTDAGSDSEISEALNDLRHINSWFGGVSTSTSTIKYVAEAAKKKSLSMLEVAAGSGYVAERVARQLEKQQVDLNVTLLDRASSHLESRLFNNGGHGRNPANRVVVGDALALPFAHQSFDLVSCNLFVHHLDSAQIVQFVNEALRCCRLGVVINDLIRNSLHLALVYTSLPLYRSRITRNDAPASVRQAYTSEELGDILRQTTAARIEIHKHFLFRMGAIAWKCPLDV